MSTSTHIQNYVRRIRSSSSSPADREPNKTQFDLTERVAAAYVMNTLDLSARARLVAGVRVESTHVDTLSFNANTGRRTSRPAATTPTCCRARR